MITNNVNLLSDFLSRNLMIIITGTSGAGNSIVADEIVSAYQDICNNQNFLLIEDAKLSWEDPLNSYAGKGLVISAGSPFSLRGTKEMLGLCQDKLKLEPIVFYLEQPNEKIPADVAFFEAEGVSVYRIDMKLGPDRRRAILRKLTDHFMTAA